MGEKAKLWVPSKGRVQGFLVSACSSSLEVPWYITNDKLKPRGEFAWGAYQTQDTPRKGAPQPSITHSGAVQRGVYPGSSKHAKAYAAPNQILMGACSSSIAGGRVVTNRLKALGLLLLRVVGASDSSIYACIQPCVLCENVPTLRTSGLAFLFFAFCVETPPLLHFSVHLVLPPLMHDHESKEQRCFRKTEDTRAAAFCCCCCPCLLCCCLLSLHYTHTPYTGTTQPGR
jgi:hypothetical protein